MLNEKQKNVLVLLRDLSVSALSLSEQAGYVALINEAILKLEDEVEEGRLLGAEYVEDESFVRLARRRLVEAQQSALTSFNQRRLARVARLSTHDDLDLNADTAREAPGDEPYDQNDEDIARGVRESKSESITRVLQRMHEMAQAEILKSELNISELDMSSKTLRELQEKYSAVDVLLNGSRRLVKVLDEADKWDRRCMQASLGFLAAVLMYIIYRRILSGPIKILLWSLFQFIGVMRWLVPQQPEPYNAPLTSKVAGHAFSSLSTEAVEPIHSSIPYVAPPEEVILTPPALSVIESVNSDSTAAAEVHGDSKTQLEHAEL